ncbi:MAG: efflux RND transporter periplasmic adaptor subunit [Syntrophobacteria bacterium]
MTGRVKIVSFLIIILIIVVGVLTNPRWWNEHRTPASDVRKAVVSRRTIHRTVVSSGTVKLQVGAEVKVGSRISGTVSRLFVQVGDRVEKGEVVAIIEHEDLLSKIRQAEAVLNNRKAKLYAIQQTRPREINQARASIEELAAKLDMARLTHQRQRSLREGDYVSQESLDKAKNEVKVLEAQLLSARENLALIEARYETDLQVARSEVAETEAELESARINLAYATIRAPISGVVGSISTQEGETVAASLSAPTFITLIDLDRLQIHDFVDETDIGMVQVGQEARFMVDAYPGHIIKGKVETIYPMATIQENVVYYEVIISILDQGEAVIRPEMTANVRIIIDSHPQALAIPNEAIVRKDGKHLVAALDPAGNIKKRRIKVGWVDNEYTEILSGLKEGETVLIGGSLKDAATK